MKKAVRYLLGALIIIAVLLVGVYGYSKINPEFFNKDELVDVNLTVTFQQVKKEFVEDLKVGDKIYEQTQNTEIGTVIKALPVEDSVVLISDYEKGKYVETSTPEYSQRTIEISGKAKVDENSVKIGPVTAKIGSKFGFIFNGKLVHGNIMKIEINDKKKK